MIRVIREVVRGWVYLLAFITGGNFVRRARLKSCGARVKISPTAFFKFPEQIRVGNDTFINHLCSIWASEQGSISIGNDVLLGPGVTIVSSNHGIAAGRLIREQPSDDADVVIGNDVWIGAHVVITPGVSIGDGCVVGAGAVVTRSLPPGSICVGVPAKVVGYRSASQSAEQVLQQAAER
jgi:acetyltransferase-like isoleucine patch superfamily enzyme